MRTILICICIALSSCVISKAPSINLPSDGLLADCIISPPPTLSGNVEKDKLLLAGAWSLQTSNLGKCNQKVKTLQVWKSNAQKQMEGK